MSNPSGEVTETRPVSSRGRKPGQKAKVREPLPAEDFVIEEVPAEERGFTRRQRGERSPQQKAVDLMVLNVRKEWRELGSPRNWVQMPIKRWPVNKARQGDAEFMLRKAASLHGAKLIIGNVSDKDQHGQRYPDNKVRIPFCIVDRKTEVVGMPENSELS